MSKIHYFQRYSSPENTVTNNTLQLIARVYSYSPISASKLLSEITGQDIYIGIEITQQNRTPQSVPDGRIVQDSFNLLIEAKVDSPVDPDQLMNHAASFKNESVQILLLLTKQALTELEETKLRAKIKAKYPRVTFKPVTYEDICKSLSDLFHEYEYEIREIADDYRDYCNDTGLFDQSAYLMRIVPCGESLEINRQFGIYFQPSDRGYTNHSFIGIYASKAVQLLWKIDSVFDVELIDGSLSKKLIQGRDTDQYDENIKSIVTAAKSECGYEVASGHRFFCGKPLATNFRKDSRGGVQGARFCNLKELLGKDPDIATVAEELRKKTWI